MIRSFKKNNQINILIIDDDPKFLKIIESKLNLFHFNIFTSTNYTDGLTYIKNNNINFIILDYQLSEQNGIIIFKELKKIHHDIPIMIISSLNKIEFDDMPHDIWFKKKPLKNIDCQFLKYEINNWYNQYDSLKIAGTFGSDICTKLNEKIFEVNSLNYSKNELELEIESFEKKYLRERSHWKKKNQNLLEKINQLEQKYHNYEDEFEKNTRIFLEHQEFILINKKLKKKISSLEFDILQLKDQNKQLTKNLIHTKKIYDNNILIAKSIQSQSFTKSKIKIQNIENDFNLNILIDPKKIKKLYWPILITNNIGNSNISSKYPIVMQSEFTFLMNCESDRNSLSDEFYKKFGISITQRPIYELPYYKCINCQNYTFKDNLDTHVCFN